MFSIVAQKLWNDLSIHIRQASSLSILISGLKTIFSFFNFNLSLTPHETFLLFYFYYFYFILCVSSFMNFILLLLLVCGLFNSLCCVFFNDLFIVVISSVQHFVTSCVLFFSNFAIKKC